MEHHDYYKILRLEHDAGPEAIRNAYRELALKYHPDRNRNDEAAVEKMKQVNEAYAVLSDPGKKQEYDHLRQQFGQSARSQFRQSYSDNDIFEGSDIYAVFEEMSRTLGLRGFDDIFKEFYGRGFQRRFRGGGRGFFGGGFVFFGRPGRGRCSRQPFFLPGLEKIAGMLFNKLAAETMPRKGTDMHGVIHLSQEHALKGGPYAYYHRQQDKKLVVRIPPNIRSNQRIRLSGMGGKSKNGGAPGDLYLRVLVRADFIGKAKRILGGLLGNR